MSLNLTVPRVAAAAKAPNGERIHKLCLKAAYLIAGLLMLAMLVYGFDYYWLSAAQRAFSPKHAYLKPSGTIGLRLGMIGFLMFLLIYLYPLRKKWAWLGRQGKSRHWLDFHVLLGLSAPVVITFHASFKFSGIAGVAYWIMIIVSLSGIVGRYIYAQIPRSLNFAELSFKEAQEQCNALAAQMQALGILTQKDLSGLVRLPNLQQTERMSLITALLKMILFDVAFPFRVWRLRQKMLWSHTRSIFAIAGFRRSPNLSLERAIQLARQQTLISKRILFLSKSHKMFQLWHVIHRPFSYSFALLATIHVVLMLMLGYY
ncbi:MAG: hypothetical protein WA517_09145 [Candidatus Acidiferrum sp.]